MDRLLTRRDAADILRVSVSTLERHLRAGRITVCKIGRATRIRPGELERFVAAREGPLTEIGVDNFCDPPRPQI